MLADYAHLVARVYEYAENMPASEAIDRAVQRCIDEGVLRGYLTERRAEVTSWLLTEYDEREHLYWTRREGWEEGREAGRAEGKAEGRAEGMAEGKAEGRTEILTQLVRDGLITARDAAARLGVPEGELAALLDPPEPPAPEP